MVLFNRRKSEIDIFLELVAIKEIRKNLVVRQRKILNSKVTPKVKEIRRAISNGVLKKDVAEMVDGSENSLSVFLNACVWISSFFKVDKDKLKDTLLEGIFR
jgi:hypothetical protein